MNSRLSTIITALTVAGWLTGFATSASAITFNFSGTINSLGTPEISGVFSIGDTFSGTITYDENATGSGEFYTGAITSFQAVTSGGYAGSNASGDLRVRNDVGGGLFDRFTAIGTSPATGADIGDFIFTGLFIALEDSDAVALSSNAIPTSFDLNQYEIREFSFRFLHSFETRTNDATGTLTSLTVVPAPAAVYLFGSALGLLGWMKRKA